MSGRLSWIDSVTGNGEGAQLRTVDDLDRLLDRLTAHSIEFGTPFNVTVFGPEGTSMDIILGAPLAAVQWMRVDPWCCLAGVTAEVVAADDPISFVGNGQHSELPRRWWIDAPAARQAVRHYFGTGQLTAVLRWEQF